jgi:hypothetical protein
MMEAQMATSDVEQGSYEVPRQDFLFTWKPGHWPEEELRRFVNEFEEKGIAEEPWRCAAYKKVSPGDRAYLLKQGKTIGIFGRGVISGAAERTAQRIDGEREWRVPIRFEVLRGDMLRNPIDDPFLVDERDLLSIPVPKTQWENQSSGITLRANAARAIDDLIFASLMVGRSGTTWTDEAVQEVARQRKLYEQKIRPEQQRFSEMIRKNYGGRCAMTGCVTAAALEAAHIRVKTGADDNSPANGILLRSDVHALFDRLLITFSEDLVKVEISPELVDPVYAFLNHAPITRPDKAAPSAENVREHRDRFLERQSRRRLT